MVSSKPGTCTTDILNEEDDTIETIITVLDVLSSTLNSFWSEYAFIYLNSAKIKFILILNQKIDRSSTYLN